jgi:uncharacterized protein (DUF2147 family)
MFAMKSLGLAMTLALLATGSAAHAGSIIDTIIGASDGRLKIEDGAISLGKQKLVVKKSDIAAVFKDLDVGEVVSSVKSAAREHDRAAAATHQAKPGDTASAARADDRTAKSGAHEEPAPSRYEDRPDSLDGERPAAPPAMDAIAPVEQKVAVAAPVAVPAVADPKSPLGEWITEDGQGRVRIRSCGQALCGVVSSADPNDTDRHNPDASKRNRPLLGLPVLIDMKPAKSNRWEGQIYNAKNGKTYASNISLKNPDLLRVEGCVFGGLFCGGQDWTRAKNAPQG